ncbi:MAG: DUF4189 domain-containing protein [Oligoflexales bacterium]|nr:DUF4189 domain-containing protein [Oligoflexales bacterium]
MKIITISLSFYLIGLVATDLHAEGSCTYPSNTVENELFTYINNQRTNKMICDLGAWWTAYYHNKDMCDNNFFSHVGSDGKRLGERLTRQGVTYTMAAENIYMGSGTSVSGYDVYTSWYNSKEGHRENMFNSNYGRVGISVYRCSNSDRTYATAVFVNPLNNDGGGNGEDTYAAIALSTSTRDWGTAWKFTTQSSATENALKACSRGPNNASDCKLITAVKNSCAALAMGYNAYGWSNHDNLQTAEANAVSYCNQKTTSCAIATKVCSNGSHQNGVNGNIIAEEDNTSYSTDIHIFRDEPLND